MIKKISGLIYRIKFLLVTAFVALAVGAVSISRIDIKQAEANQSISDVNNDGVINLVDARILTPPATTSCSVCVDVNGDKIINQVDVSLVQTWITKTAPGDDSLTSATQTRLDVNNDGIIDSSDVAIIQSYFDQTVAGPVFGLDNPSELTFGFMANILLVKFKPGVEGSNKNPVFSKYNLVNESSFNNINAEKLRTTEGNVESLQKQLANESIVERSFKDYVVEWQTNDPGWDSQWNLRKIRIEETWYTETTGSSSNPVRVAVIDSGFDVNHEDLQKNLSSLRRNSIVTDPSDPAYRDVSGNESHGTAIAGIIGATVDNNKDLAGVIPNVEIIPVKGINSESSIATGFEWAMNQEGVKVINMSFGMGYNDENAHLTSDMLRQAREEKGITLIASAGNEGRDDCSYPARHPNVVCVGSTKSDDSISSSSSGKTDADVFAPGYCVPLLRPGNYWSVCNDGTSYAASLISGVAALCRTVRPLPESLEITREDLKCRNFDMTADGRVDAWPTIWYRNCFKFDFNGNGFVGSADAQSLARRVNVPSQYDIRYDIYPVGTDGKIDFSDALFILSRTQLSCPLR